MFDAVIIGAGPAGSAAAYDLAAAGCRVMLADKRAFPREKACAGGITPRAYSLFRFDVSGIVRRQCRVLEITPPRGSRFRIQDSSPLCHMTRRRDLDLLARDQAVQRGAEFRVIQKILSINERPGHVEILVDGERIRAACLIGADGVNSRIRQLAGFEFDIVKNPAIEADILLERPGYGNMEFDFSLVPKGYFWVFPRDDHVNIGIYSARAGNKIKRQLLYDYASARLPGGKIVALKGYPIGTGGYCRRPGKGRVLLAGDAAGLAEPCFGEGIFFAVKSGQVAARAILDGGQDENPGPRYNQAMGTVRRDLCLYHWGARFLYRYPSLFFKGLSLPFVRRRFARGYARGKSLATILVNG